MYRNNVLCCLAGLVALALPAVGLGQTLQFHRVTASLASPVFVTHAPGDFDRLFIAQRGGHIRILDLNDDTLNAANFITIPGVLAGGEQGLLGLAFHPDYANNGFFYVNFTDNTGGDTRIMQFSVTANPDVADPASGVLLLEINQPESNHNGGWIAFGPDGYLYIAMGDGGGGNDTGSGHTAGTGNAQDTSSNLLGKMLRIDVDGDDFPEDENRNYAIPSDNPFVDVAGDDEIFLYGLRNPWRCSFDRLTWDLFIGDVGQGAREEIDVRYSGSAGNRNYGWRLREGMIATPTTGIGGPPPADNVNPIYDYNHGGGDFSGPCIVGGYVYRGMVTDLRGHYFFADNVADKLWSLKFDGSAETSFDGTNYTAARNWTDVLTTDVGTISNISSFGEDAAGNLYVCDLNGELYRLVGGSISIPVAVDSFDLLRGTHLGGDVAELADSDDTYLTVRSMRGPRGEPPVWIEFFGTAPGVPEALSFDIESNTTGNGLVQRIELFNFDTGQFQMVDSRPATAIDQVVSLELAGDGSQFVSPEGEVRARLGWKVQEISAFSTSWQVNVDQLRWRFVE